MDDARLAALRRVALFGDEEDSSVAAHLRQCLGEALDAVDDERAVLDRLRAYVRELRPKIPSLRTTPDRGHRANEYMQAGVRAVLADVEEILGGSDGKEASG